MPETETTKENVQEAPPVDVQEQLEKIKEEMETIQQRVMLPEVDTVMFRNVEVKIKPLPYSYTKKMKKTFEEARTVLQKIHGARKEIEDLKASVEASGSTLEEEILNRPELTSESLELDIELGGVLSSLFEVIAEFYSLPVDKPVEDNVSVGEIMPIVEAQVAKQGEQDFLFAPLRLILYIIRFSENALR